MIHFFFNPLHYAFHHDARWDFARHFRFAAGQPALPLARSELRDIAQVAPVAVQQVGPELRAVVITEAAWCREPVYDESFSWRRGRAPLALRYHPFKAMLDARTGEKILSVATDEECVSADRSNAFFDDQARPLPTVRAIIRRLHGVEVERAQLDRAAAALAGAGLLRTLPGLRDARGRTLFQTIDWAAFQALTGEAVAALGEDPSHAVMLAMSLAFSQAHFKDEIRRGLGGAASLPPAGREESPAVTPAGEQPFLVGDDDLVFTFE